MSNFAHVYKSGSPRFQGIVRAAAIAAANAEIGNDGKKWETFHRYFRKAMAERGDISVEEMGALIDWARKKLGI